MYAHVSQLHNVQNLLNIIRSQMRRKKVKSRDVEVIEGTAEEKKGSGIQSVHLHAHYSSIMCIQYLTIIAV